MTLVRLNVDRKRIISKPGTTLKMYGHTFTVRRDRTAVCDMDDEFLQYELAADRVVLIEPQQSAAPPIQQSVDNGKLDEKFGFDAKDFFGCKDEESLKKRLSPLNKGDLFDFAESRLGITLAQMNKTEAIDEIVKTAKVQKESVEK